MSRYLTPSKIVLLTLIAIYSDGLAPSSATIPILSFAVSYILPINSSSQQAEDTRSSDNFTLSIQRIREATIVHPSAIPGRTIWDLLLKGIWAINSLDSLQAFFDDLQSLLENSGQQNFEELNGLGFLRPKRMLLSRNSPLGAFVRRSQLEFMRLQFHDGIDLWKSFVLYRAPTLVLWKRRNPAVGSKSFDVNLQQNPGDTDDKLMRFVYGDMSDNFIKTTDQSIDDAERLLDFQVSRMQRSGIRIPQSVKQRLETMTKPGSAVPNVLCYLRFLEAWKVGDYPSSFDNLHRYFDYTIQGGARGLYQYALLNLAILHADFDCFSEAITAMQETIATARENHDMPCLNYSLSWLNQFCRTHPRELRDVRKRGILGSEREALLFLKAKAKESNMLTLLSTTLLSEAKLILINGHHVSEAFESIVKASHLNSTSVATQSYGSQWLMQSNIFDRLGTSNILLADRILTSFQLARRGRYDEAFSRMNQVDSETLRNLKYQQYWITNLGILKSSRHIYRDELDMAEEILVQLRAVPMGFQELYIDITLMEIELQIRRGVYTNALSILEELLSDMEHQDVDIFQRLKGMVLKARIYHKAGVPQKGFSAAMRAASLARKSQVLPLLWGAVVVVCGVLISVKEFAASVTLIESVLPQALEGEDCMLAASLFSCLADGYVGMAGQAKPASLQRKERLTKTSESLDLALKEYLKIEDVRGQSEAIAKKSTILHLSKDPVLANDCAARYLAIKEAARE
ncbi:MAG: hypothetical protein Q9219_003046 [cf. Caloplaca sp. 3 TL-2023]